MTEAGRQKSGVRGQVSEVGSQESEDGGCKAEDGSRWSEVAPVEHPRREPQRNALHLACAEDCKADIFLTTDDKLLRLARECFRQLKIKVDNPLTWLRGVIENEYRKYDS